MKQRWLRGEPSTKFNSSFKETSRNCSKKNSFVRRVARGMRSRFSARSSLKEIPWNTSISLRRHLSSKRYRRRWGSRRSSRRKIKILSKILLKIQRRRKERRKSRRWHLCLIWFQAVCPKWCQTPKFWPKLPISLSAFLELITLLGFRLPSWPLPCLVDSVSPSLSEKLRKSIPTTTWCCHLFTVISSCVKICSDTRRQTCSRVWS